MMIEKKMIQLDKVSFSYEPGRPILQDLSLHIHKGESVGLIGANGAGKSTILKLMLGLLTPQSGTVRVDGLDMNRENIATIRRKLGFVLQNSDNQLFMPTVEEDMMFAKVDEVLEQLNLTELKYRHNHRISGGEKRMAAIATILVMEPEAVLMDEPSAALDPCNRRTVIDTIRGMEQTRLITSHDLDMILDTCERVILLDKGKIVADGKTEEILRDQELLEAHRMELPFCFAGSRY